MAHFTSFTNATGGEQIAVNFDLVESVAPSGRQVKLTFQGERNHVYVTESYEEVLMKIVGD